MPAKEQRTTVGTAPGYDQSLIAQAPEITKLDRQEGYDINLVEQGRKTPLSPPSRPRTVGPTTVAPPRSGSRSSHEKSTPPLPAHVYSNDVPKSQPKPWYRTTKGMAIIAFVALVLVGVIVGVAVGVTRKKGNASPIEQGSVGNSGQSIGETPQSGGGLGPTSSVVPVSTSANGAAVSSGVTGSNNNGNGNAPNAPSR